MKTCSLSGCVQPLYARTWCEAHYKRWRKTGDVRVDEPLGRYGPAQTERTAAKLRGRVRGPHSPEWNAAISAAKKGRSNGLEGTTRTPTTRARIAVAHQGERNGSWKGDAVGYVALHERVRKTLPKVCLHCGATERLQAALRNDAAGPIRVGSMKVRGEVRDVRYSTDPNDYIRLCYPCHRAYDGLLGYGRKAT